MTGILNKALSRATPLLVRPGVQQPPSHTTIDHAHIPAKPFLHWEGKRRKTKTWGFCTLQWAQVSISAALNLACPRGEKDQGDLGGQSVDLTIWFHPWQSPEPLSRLSSNQRLSCRSGRPRAEEQGAERLVCSASPGSVSAGTKGSLGVFSRLLAWQKESERKKSKSRRMSSLRPPTTVVFPPGPRWFLL